MTHSELQKAIVEQIHRTNSAGAEFDLAIDYLAKLVGDYNAQFECILTIDRDFVGRVIVNR